VSNFESVELAFLRNDTNNGKLYCIECGANERKGKVTHKADCALVEVKAALKAKERETVKEIVALLHTWADEPWGWTGLHEFADEISRVKLKTKKKR
jgi:hypothetical protein